MSSTAQQRRSTEAKNETASALQGTSTLALQHLTTSVLLATLLCLVGCDPLITRLPIDGDSSQGIFGTVMFLPGVCLQDPENPGQCLNGPYPGRASFVIRARLDEPDMGLDSPIIQSFESDDDGTFWVGLPTGKYCVWQMNACTPVDIEADQWTKLSLVVALP